MGRKRFHPNACFWSFGKWCHNSVAIDNMMRTNFCGTCSIACILNSNFWHCRWKCRTQQLPNWMENFWMRLAPVTQTISRFGVRARLSQTYSAAHFRVRWVVLRSNQQANNFNFSHFYFLLALKVRCLICGMESKKHDPFLDLSLDIPEKFYKNSDADGRSACSIADCLSSFTEVGPPPEAIPTPWTNEQKFTFSIRQQIEELAETELYYCNSCKCKQKSTKRFWIRRLPNVLCLHIKRFRWNNFFRTKIDLRIKFPIKSLDMSQYVLNNGPETRRSSSSNNVYDLAAVIVHHGNGYVSHIQIHIKSRPISTLINWLHFRCLAFRSSCGHYTSFAINNGTWLHFNDHTVKEVLPAAVAECKPYILFYIRRDLNKQLWD